MTCGQRQAGQLGCWDLSQVRLADACLLQDLIEANHGRGRQNGRRRSRWFELRNGRPLFLHLLCGDVFRRLGLFVRLRGNPQGLLGFGEVLLCHLFGLGHLLVTCNGLVEGLSLGFSGSKFRSCGSKVFLQRVPQGSVPILGELQDVTLQACDLLAELLQTELLEWTVLMMSWALHAWFPAAAIDLGQR